MKFAEDFFMPKTFDPLAYIPSPKAIRRRLDETERLARRLRILLGTAEAIERDESGESEAARRQEVQR